MLYNGCFNAAKRVALALDSLIRGKYVVWKVENRNEARVIEDGAVFQRDGVIIDVGRFDALSHHPYAVAGPGMMLAVALLVGLWFAGFAGIVGALLIFA